MDIKEKIHSLSEDLLKNIERLVVINSQLGTPAEGMPFGPGPAKALDEALSIARELGFKTVNLDHYCGYAEMGEGDDIVGIAGHLDIVPEVTGLMIHLPLPAREIMYMAVERPMTKALFSKHSMP